MIKLVSLHNKNWKMKEKAWKLFQIYGGVRFSILQIKLHVTTQKYLTHKRDF